MQMELPLAHSMVKELVDLLATHSEILKEQLSESALARMTEQPKAKQTGMQMVP